LDTQPGDTRSVFELLLPQAEVASDCLNAVETEVDMMNDATAPSAEDDALVVMRELSSTARVVRASISEHRLRTAAAEINDAAATACAVSSLPVMYVDMIRAMAMDRLVLCNDAGVFSTHKFRNDISAASTSNFRACLTRVNKELRVLKTSLPIDFPSRYC
jgi:hypothetical protein